MKKVSVVVVFSILSFAVMSCGLFDKFTGLDKDFNKAPELWSDVPKMDGLAPSDLELPFAVKLFMRTALNNLWRTNKEGEDRTPVQGDWIVFSTAKAPTDVQAFYTNERMTGVGNWEPSKKSTCIDGKDKGIPGVLCIFQKKAESNLIQLMIVAIQDDKTKQTNVFYLRLEGPAEAAKPNG